jgi:lysophospholipase L1-like esterase
MRLILTIFFCILIYSCSKKITAPAAGLPPANLPPASSADTKTYLALGDSYTIGQSVAGNERFPAQIVALLRQQGIKIADPVYIAQTGWTTANLQNAITNQNPPNTFDVVSLLIGVNDQYQKMDTAGYAIRFAQLLQKAIQLAGGKKESVFVLSIPDYSVTPFVPAGDKQRVAMEIDKFNEINFLITSSYGVSYTNITPSTRQATTNTSFIANDNLHPSGLEYKKWAEMLAPKMGAVLQ